MATHLSNNPTCVLTDADMYSESQKAKMAKNLMAGLPATPGEGDKVLVLDENGDPQLKDYSAGGGGGTSYTAGDGINITSDTISVKVDHETIDYNEYGQLASVSTGSSGGYTTIEFPNSVDDYQSFFNSIEAAMSSNLIPVVVYQDSLGEGVYKHVKLVLSNSINTTREGPSDSEYWFVGSTFEPTDGEHGTLKHIIVKAAYYGESDTYEVVRNTTVQSSVSYV